MSFAKPVFIAFLLLCLPVVPVQAELKVVASIKPVHSLVSAVMAGVGTPGIIVEGSASPHTYALKPSQARQLASADIVFWLGPELEAFLGKALETIAANAKPIELLDTDGLARFRFREGGSFEKHDDHQEHKHQKKHQHNHQHDHHHHDDHAEFDPHVWLDPANAKILVTKVASVLATSDPANAATYESNAVATRVKLDALISEMTSLLEPAHSKGFIVFHDAYQYFEKRFDLAAAGSITVSPERMPGAERVTEIRAKVRELGATCVFAEPQFEPKLVSTVLEGTPARAGVLDPLGAELQSGPDLYFELIRNMGQSIKTCLSQKSS